MSLFGDLEDNDVMIQHPEPPKDVERWSTLERLNREKELVGLFLSAHPLDEFKFQLLYACNTTMAELESIPNPRGAEDTAKKLAELASNPAEMERIRKIQSRDITCGGIVTGWREGTSKSGNPYGILTIEDYSGKHEFPLFGEAFPQWRGFGKEGMYLYIQAKYQPKRFLRGEPRTVFDVEFSIGRIQQLSQVADGLIDDLTVMIDSRKLTRSSISQLSDAVIKRMLDDEETRKQEAKTALHIELCDASKGYAVRLYSRKYRTRISKPFIEFLNDIDGVALRINNKLVEEQVAAAEENDGEMEDDANELPDD